jgi:hypothetical protein
MLVIDIFNSSSLILEIGIHNTSNCVGNCNSPSFEDGTYIYEFGIIENGKIKTILGSVVHKQADCGLLLVFSVFKELYRHNLISFNRAIFKKYIIYISINRRKLVEDIIVLFDKNNNIFSFGFKSIYSKKMDTELGQVVFDNKSLFIQFLFEIFHKILHLEDLKTILDNRIIERDRKDFFDLALAVNLLEK